MEKKFKIKKENNDNLTQISISVENDFSLFRYRSISEFTLNALLNNEMWSSRPDIFNDPYDTSFVVNKNKLVKYALSKLNNDFFLEYANEKNIKSININEIANQFIQDIYRQSLNSYKMLYMVVCFSEDIYNEAMWAHYANDGKGFAIEYTYSDITFLRNSYCNFYVEASKFLNRNFELLKEYLDNLSYDSLKQFNTSKVFYLNNKYDNTDLFIMLIDWYVKQLNEPNPNFLDLLKHFKDVGLDIFDSEKNKIISDSIVFIKNKIWEYEKEWRLLIPNPIIDISDYKRTHYKVGNIFPKAVYLGEFISNPNKIIIYNYCYINGIELYQMYSNLTNKKYKLCRKEISKEQMIDFLNTVGKFR